MPNPIVDPGFFNNSIYHRNKLMGEAIDDLDFSTEELLENNVDELDVDELVTKKFDEIIRKFEGAFLLGCADAAFELAKLYLGESHEHFLKDESTKSTAKTWLIKGLVIKNQKCIERIGSAIAALQEIDEKKKDLSLDNDDVVEILEKAFELGYVQAAYKLGELYLHDFFEADAGSAREWFEKGLAAGDARCKEAIEDCDESLEEGLDETLYEGSYEESDEELRLTPVSPSPRR